MRAIVIAVLSLATLTIEAGTNWNVDARALYDEVILGVRERATSANLLHKTVYEINPNYYDPDETVDEYLPSAQPSTNYSLPSTYAAIYSTYPSDVQKLTDFAVYVIGSFCDTNGAALTRTNAYAMAGISSNGIVLKERRITNPYTNWLYSYTNYYPGYTPNIIRSTAEVWNATSIATGLQITTNVSGIVTNISTNYIWGWYSNATPIVMPATTNPAIYENGQIDTQILGDYGFPTQTLDETYRLLSVMRNTKQNNAGWTNASIYSSSISNKQAQGGVDYAEWLTGDNVFPLTFGDLVVAPTNISACANAPTSSFPATIHLVTNVIPMAAGTLNASGVSVAPRYRFDYGWQFLLDAYWGYYGEEIEWVYYYEYNEEQETWILNNDQDVYVPLTNYYDTTTYIFGGTNYISRYASKFTNTITKTSLSSNVVSIPYIYNTNFTVVPARVTYKLTNSVIWYNGTSITTSNRSVRIQSTVQTNEIITADSVDVANTNFTIGYVATTNLSLTAICEDTIEAVEHASFPNGDYSWVQPTNSPWNSADVIAHEGDGSWSQTGSGALWYEQIINHEFQIVEWQFSHCTNTVSGF